METTTRRNCPDTPARWEAARIRAIASSIAIRQDMESGDFFATSKDGRREYRVRWYACECQAATAGDPVCCHRAAFRLHCRAEDAAVERMLAAVPTFDEVTEPAHVAELFATDEEGTPVELLPVTEPIDTDGDDDPDPAPSTAARLASGACPDCLDSGYVSYFGNVTTCRCSIGRSRPFGGGRVPSSAPAAEPVAAIAEVGDRRCSACDDTGIARTYTGGRLTDYVEHHCGCPVGRDLRTSGRVAA